MNKPVCLDTSAWLEIALAGPNATKFSQCLLNNATIITSVISIYEISRFLTREAGESNAEATLAYILQYSVIPVSIPIAQSAANYAAMHKLAMADAFIYATTISQNATLWTQDCDFDGLPHVKYFPKVFQ